MHRSLTLGALVSITIAGPASAQQSPSILISATGTVESAPDKAFISYDLRGEGSTSDEALEQLNAREAAIRAATTRFLGAPAKVETGAMHIQPVRGQKCNMGGYNSTRLTEGDCAILGYAAEIAVKLETSKVTEVGTLAGLIGRHEGLNPKVSRFALSDTSEAQREAMRRALADAREQAELIAKSSGMKLGPVLRIQDSNYREITVKMAAPARGSSASTIAAPPPPPPPPPPVGVSLSPAPIETSVRIMVAYSILP